MTAKPRLSAEMLAAPRLEPFNLVDIDYKKVNGTPVPASILIPKNAEPGKHPVLVRWHGGCFITGHRLFPEWLGEWILNLALSRKAILITPDYRLLPEATGLDILQDVRDFYSWLFTTGNLASHFSSGIDPDLDHLLVTGESAGGWLAVQSSLLPAPRERISAVISHYPMIDMRNGHYTEDYEKTLFDPPAPQLDRSILRNYIENLKGDEVATSGIPPERVPLVVSAMQQGAFGKLFGGDSSLYPIEMLDQVNELPPTWILHGKEDNVVPVAGTQNYVDKLKEKLPDTKVHVSYRPGMHGFDNHPAATLEDDWVKEGLEFIGPYWPKT